MLFAKIRCKVLAHLRGDAGVFGAENVHQRAVCVVFPVRISAGMAIRVTVCDAIRYTIEGLVAVVVAS